MTTVITGKIRFSADHVDAVKAAMVTMMTASQTEDGCIDYVFAQDLSDPALFHVIEVWDDDAALARHFKTPHMAAFNEALLATPPLSLEALHHAECVTERFDAAAFMRKAG